MIRRVTVNGMVKALRAEASGKPSLNRAKNSIAWSRACNNSKIKMIIRNFNTFQIPHTVSI